MLYQYESVNDKSANALEKIDNLWYLAPESSALAERKRKMVNALDMKIERDTVTELSKKYDTVDMSSLLHKEINFFIN